MHHVDEELKNTLRFSPYYLANVELDKSNHGTRLLDAAQMSRDHRGRGIVSMKRCFTHTVSCGKPPA